MTKTFLIVYMISLLGTGNGLHENLQKSTFDSTQDCQAALKTILVKDYGKDFSGRIVAYCASQDFKIQDDARNWHD